MDLAKLTRYISIWMWMLISIQFLIGAFIIFALERTLISQSIYVSFIMIFVITLSIALNKRYNFYAEEEEE